MKTPSVSCSRPLLFVQTDEQREIESEIFNTTLVCVTNALQLEIWQQHICPNPLFCEVQIASTQQGQ